MLAKVTVEKPHDWDLYLPCVLFAYREIPQSSTGFSPFELVYGAKPRGPMDILKTLLYKQDIDKESRSTYERVIEVRDHIIRVCESARISFEEKGQ